MMVHPKTLKADGAAFLAGIKGGDLIVAVTADGRGGIPVKSAVQSRERYLQCVGPQNEVFEGSTIVLTVIRDKAAQAKWDDKLGQVVDKDSEAARTPFSKERKEAWFAALATIPTVDKPVTLLQETDNVRSTRTTKMEAMKKRKGLKKMDVGLVNDFMYDPFDSFITSFTLPCF